jgi:hypothetical protein
MDAYKPLSSTLSDWSFVSGRGIWEEMKGASFVFSRHLTEKENKFKTPHPSKIILCFYTSLFPSFHQHNF